MEGIGQSEAGESQEGRERNNGGRQAVDRVERRMGWAPEEKI